VLITRARLASGKPGWPVLWHSGPAGRVTRPVRPPDTGWLTRADHRQGRLANTQKLLTSLAKVDVDPDDWG